MTDDVSSPIPPNEEPLALPKPPEQSTPPEPPIIPQPIDVVAVTRRWVKILLARNPFYIISAALLLWSMRDLSLDSRVFKNELPQLIFNFSSFQFYELLLVWYDSGLLVALENLFICVPFLLVSQALLLENNVAIGLCVAGGALALLRVGALKRWLKELNMPASLLASGALLLVFNFAWPVAIRMLHKNLDVPAWDDRGLRLVDWEWNWIIPIAVGLGAFLPVRGFATNMAEDEEPPFYSWRSFPLLALFAWVAGTCVHFYCISYVYNMPWRSAYLAPALWMAAWMLWRHADNFASEKVRLVCQRIFLCLPALVVIASAETGRWKMLLTLTVLNAVAYGARAFLRRDGVAKQLCAGSALLALGFVPHPAVAHHELSHAGTLAGCALFYIVAWAVLSARPALGIAGGFCLAAAMAHLLPNTNIAFNLSLQAGAMFTLLHSIRWGASWKAEVFRHFFELCWLVHTILWVALDPNGAIYPTMACGASLLGLYALIRVLQGAWGSADIAYCAVVAVGVGPLYLACANLRHQPGLVALLASFALFAVGTAVAIMKSRLIGQAKEAK